MTWCSFPNTGPVFDGVDGLDRDLQAERSLVKKACFDVSSLLASSSRTTITSNERLKKVERIYTNDQVLRIHYEGEMYVLDVHDQYPGHGTGILDVRIDAMSPSTPSQSKSASWKMI